MSSVALKVLFMFLLASILLCLCWEVMGLSIDYRYYHYYDYYYTQGKTY